MKRRRAREDLLRAQLESENTLKKAAAAVASSQNNMMRQGVADTSVANTGEITPVYSSTALDPSMASRMISSQPIPPPPFNQNNGVVRDTSVLEAQEITPVQTSTAVDPPRSLTLQRFPQPPFNHSTQEDQGRDTRPIKKSRHL